MEGKKITVENLCYQKHLKTSSVEGYYKAVFLTVKIQFKELLLCFKRNIRSKDIYRLLKKVKSGAVKMAQREKCEYEVQSVDK